MKTGLVPLIADIAKAKASNPELNFDQSFVNSEAYSTALQEKLGSRISRDLGFNFDSGRLVSHHSY